MTTEVSIMSTAVAIKAYFFVRTQAPSNYSAASIAWNRSKEEIDDRRTS